MHVGYVLIPYQRHTGAGEHYHHLIKEVLRLDPVNKYTVFFPAHTDMSAFENTAGITCVCTPIRSAPGAVRYAQVMLSRFIESYRPKVDILHCLNFPLPVFHKGKIVLTIHDLREEDLPESFGWPHRLVMRWMSPVALKKAHHIITVSRFTQNRLEAHYPFCKGKTSTAYNAIDPSEFAMQPKTLPAPRNRPYLFTIGQIAPHKNLANLIRAFNFLLERGCDYDLVIAGHNFGSAGFAKSLYALPSDKNRVLFTGRVTNQEKFAYLKNAKLFVYPSLYEGFGIPLLEAFAVKTPLAVSRIPAFEEIFGFPEAMFDPKSPENIANVIERICTNQPLRNRIVSYGIKKLEEFTWEKTARATLSIYNNLARS